MLTDHCFIFFSQTEFILVNETQVTHSKQAVESLNMYVASINAHLKINPVMTRTVMFAHSRGFSN